MIEIVQIPVLDDNYVYVIHDAAAQATGAVDPALADPVLALSERRGWRLTHVINTHHHGDHVGGNLELKRRTGATVVGPRADRDRIPGIDVEVGEGDIYTFGTSAARVFDVPGHTRGHIAYWFEQDQALFCGDTLFSMGCGRLFEGTPAQMWQSLSKLCRLPGDTRVYCAHEYTAANGRFALTLEPGNEALLARMREVQALRAQGAATVPSTLATERATNPFLRPHSEALQRSLGLIGADAVRVFAEARARKDVFRG
jgi:hydroxyacylglutathione hydrolase